MTRQRKIVGTQDMGSPDGTDVPAGNWAGVLKHQRIPYVSYPYEWTFGMLQDAALLQLEWLTAALDEGMILKDSSAFDIQWWGTQPVFIDIPSFEKLDEGEPWVGYRQFCQLFLYPLFLQSYRHAPFHPWLRGSIDGITPTDANALMSVRDRLRPGVFTHVYLQAKLQRRHGSKTRSIKQDLKAAGFNKGLIQVNVRQLTKLVGRLYWQPQTSEWADYTNLGHYQDQDMQRKVDFVRDVVQAAPNELVWDLGANTGTFSRIAAENWGVSRGYGC